MTIGLVDGECTADTISDVESVLKQRFKPGFGAFWLSHSDSGYPMLNVHIRSDVAFLHFQEQEGEPGFLSVGDFTNTDQQGSTEFAISVYAADDLVVPNKNVVPITIALEAAKEFYSSGTRPKCVDWVENR